MSINPTQPPGGPETPSPKTPQIPGIHPRLQTLVSRRSQAKIDLGKAENDDLNDLIKELKLQIDNFDPDEPDLMPENNNSDQEGLKPAGQAIKPQPGATTDKADNSEFPSASGLPSGADRHSSNSLLANRTTNPPTTFAVPVLQSSTEKTGDLLFDSTAADSDNNLPRLVRLDSKPLRPAEELYPAMGYNENVYEAWPDKAKRKATEHYPDFPLWQAAITQANPNSADDLRDPDYYQLPSNPTLKDQYLHGIWKARKASGT